MTKEIRLRLELRALTIAGARMGRGACQIVPTLREWTGNTIVIGPKSEATKTPLFISACPLVTALAAAQDGRLGSASSLGGSMGGRSDS